MTPLTAALGSDLPLTPDRDTAAGWAREELSRAEYTRARPGLLERLLDWVRDALSHLPDGPGGVTGRLLLAVVILAALAVAVGLWVRLAGPRRRSRLASAAGAGLAVGERTAADHRAAAAAALADGDPTTAALEYFRAVARELDAAGLVALRPGQTADEFAAAAGLVLPELAGPLRAAATDFDRFRYGGGRAEDADAERLAALDREVRRAARRQPAGIAR